MEVGKTADAVSFSLLDSHSFYSHSQKVLKCLSSNSFPFCEARLSFFGRDGRFSCKSTTADIRGIRQVCSQRAQTEYPNFGGTRKFVEGCRQALRPQAQRHLTFPRSAVTSHRKTPPAETQSSTREKATLLDRTNIQSSGINA